MLLSILIIIQQQNQLLHFSHIFSERFKNITHLFKNVLN